MMIIMCYDNGIGEGFFKSACVIFLRRGDIFGGVLVGGEFVSFKSCRNKFYMFVSFIIGVYDVSVYVLL